MREILFRGKRIDNGEWIQGDLVQFPVHGIVRIVEQEPSYKDAEVDLDTVGQYTGLTDKNGKKIFDGDIIKAADAGPEYNLILFRAEGYGFFNDYYFGGEKYDTKQISGADCFWCDEVIGNIHDNPELLEVVEE